MSKTKTITKNKTETNSLDIWRSLADRMNGLDVEAGRQARILKDSKKWKAGECRDYCDSILGVIDKRFKYQSLMRYMAIAETAEAVKNAPELEKHLKRDFTTILNKANNVLENTKNPKLKKVTMETVLKTADKLVNTRCDNEKKATGKESPREATKADIARAIKMCGIDLAQASNTKKSAGVSLDPTIKDVQAAIKHLGSLIEAVGVSEIRCSHDTVIDFEELQSLIEGITYKETL